MNQGSGKTASKVVQLRRTDAGVGQLPLLPLRVEADIPLQRETADLKKIVRTYDHHDYAIKTTADHPMLPASEYLCYKLASVCHIPVPFSQIIEVSSGTFAFGSRFEGGVIEWSTIGPKQALETFTDAKEVISAILAFDLFVGNEDRHRGNFLFRRNRSQKWAPLAIDYSRALLVRGFPNDSFPISETCQTRTTIQQMKSAGLWCGPNAVFSLDSLRTVKTENVEHWLKELPPDWLSAEIRRGLLEWWQSETFFARINKLFSLL